MEHSETFGTYHPLINFVMFAAAIVFGMFFRSPAFLVAAVVFSSLYYVTVKGRQAIPVLLGMIPVFIVLSVINPLFNTLGDHVLFTYFDGRPYTFEALCYGMAIGAMLVAMLLWFSSYNAIMTSDKFTYLFGSVIPSVSLVLTMVLRFVPNYQRQIHQFAAARACIGKAVSEGSLRDRATNGAALLDILTSWAFENGIVVADSMRSRGYGVGKRTAYSLYRFERRDWLLLVVMVGLAAIVIVCAFFGATDVEYTPTIVLPPLTPAFWIGITAYCLFLALPSYINIRESILWSISLSKI